MRTLTKLTSSKQPKNKAESVFYSEAISKGWNLSKKGWADFFCWKDNEIMLVEVKKHRGYRLKTHQHFIFKKLTEFGIPCYTWTPEEGLIIFPTSKPL